MKSVVVKHITRYNWCVFSIIFVFILEPKKETNTYMYSQCINIKYSANNSLFTINKNTLYTNLHMGSYNNTLNIRIYLLHIVVIINAQIRFDIHSCNEYLSVRHLNNIPLPVLAEYCFLCKNYHLY